jgi:hypothetical protein
MSQATLFISTIALVALAVVSCGAPATPSRVGRSDGSALSEGGDEGEDGGSSDAGDAANCGSGPDALRCGPDQFCQAQTYQGGPGPPPGVPMLYSTIYSCQTDACKATPTQACYCALPSCQSTDGPCSWHESRRTLSCTEYTVCASPDTPISTPEGERPIADIQVGDAVYSVDHDAIRPVLVTRIGRHRAENHHVVRVVTGDGRILEISAPHPTADGRSFGDLRPGGLLDGHAIESVDVIRYAHEYTYDILPASDTGTYFAAGMQIGSTLVRSDSGTLGVQGAQ